MPYHSVETLIVEAPDHGHETTSEAYSYCLWLEAMYGKVTGDWSKFNGAWDDHGEVHHPDATPTSRPTPSTTPRKPATYAPEWDTPAEYPSQLTTACRSAATRSRAELKTAYGTGDVYGMHWLHRRRQLATASAGAATAPRTAVVHQHLPARPAGVGVGDRPAAVLRRPSSTAARTATWTCSPGTPATPSSGSTPTRPDADARAVQAAYWAQTWAEGAGQGSAESPPPSPRPPRWATTCATRCTTSTSRRSALHRARAARPAPARTARPTTCCPGTTPGAAPPTPRRAGPGASAPATTTAATRTRWPPTR